MRARFASARDYGCCSSFTHSNVNVVSAAPVCNLRAIKAPRNLCPYIFPAGIVFLPNACLHRHDRHHDELRTFQSEQEADDHFVPVDRDALLFVFLAFTVTSVLNHRKDEGMQLSSFAGVIGTNSVDALMFNDRKQAQQHPGRPQGQGGNFAPPPCSTATASCSRATAARPRDAEPRQACPPSSLDDDALADANPRAAPSGPPACACTARSPATNYQIGVVMIEADLTNMWLDILKSLGVIAAAMGGSLIVALLLASRFKGSIADPVTKLINAAQKVSASQNYNLRIAHERTDELGTLIDSFNDMLAQIEGRGAALTHHRDELERQVSVRTEQLEKAKNAAEAASRAKSAFLATMSHEIRTPMNGVLGMTEMLLGTELTETQRNYTKLVKRSGEHLLVIINDILDFSKIEAGKLSIEYINFNLWDLLDDINTIYTPQAQAKGLALDFDIANDIPVAICGDPNRLRQIMANLLGNAIKFTDRGRILAKVAVSERGQATREPALRSARHRHRRLARGAQPHLRSLLAGRQFDHPQVRRHRPGPGDLAPAGRTDGRQDRRRQCARRRARFSGSRSASTSAASIPTSPAPPATRSKACAC